MKVAKKEDAKPGDKMWVSFRQERIKITLGPDNLWRDEQGTIYGFIKDSYQKDKVTRLGIAPLVLPKKVRINDAAQAHDYAYSSPAYQEFNTRKEADKILEAQVEQLGHGTIWQALAKPIYWITRLLGGKYWENKKTNN